MRRLAVPALVVGSALIGLGILLWPRAVTSPGRAGPDVGTGVNGSPPAPPAGPDARVPPQGTDGGAEAHAPRADAGLAALDPALAALTDALAPLRAEMVSRCLEPAGVAAVRIEVRAAFDRRGRLVDIGYVLPEHPDISACLRAMKVTVTAPPAGPKDSAMRVTLLALDLP